MGWPKCLGYGSPTVLGRRRRKTLMSHSCTGWIRTLLGLCTVKAFVLERKCWRTSVLSVGANSSAPTGTGSSVLEKQPNEFYDSLTQWKKSRGHSGSSGRTRTQELYDVRFGGYGLPLSSPIIVASVPAPGAVLLHPHCRRRKYVLWEIPPGSCPLQRP